MSTSRRVRLLRYAAAITFVIFGVGKFVNHSAELASFRHYTLPAPAVFLDAIGVLELFGGLLLFTRWVRLPVAAALAADMVGAIVVSGLSRGEIISLTLAPVLLVVMLAVVWAEAAGRSGGRTQATVAGRDVGSAVRKRGARDL